MATGPEHYREAERLLAVADGYDKKSAPQLADRRRAAAQVHATLALTAATAMTAVPTSPGEDSGMTTPEFDAWEEVAGTRTSRTCSQCPTPVKPGQVYCSTACRNVDDRHDDGRDDVEGGDA